MGEFVDAMDAEVKAGRIRGIFGGSNWTRERFDAAVAYAEKHGKQRPGALSNNFALAEMQDVIWPGCVSSSDDEWKAWFRDRQIPNFAWSSQGRALLHRRAGRDKRDNEELVRVWYNERNFCAARPGGGTGREARPQPGSISRSPMCSRSSSRWCR